MPRRWWAPIDAFAQTKQAAALLFATAVAVYWLESVAWPLERGRDAWDYLSYYLQLWEGDPVFRRLMAFRTPVASVVLGVPLDLGGALLLEAVMSLLYAVAVVAWSAAALTFGRLPAVLMAIVLLAYAPFGAVFHDVSADGVFALGFALWSLGIVSTARRPAAWRYAALGVGAVALVLTRPPNQVLLAFAVVPLVLPGRLRQRLTWAAAFAGTAVALLAGWAAYNGIRYDDFTISRLRVASVPFFRQYLSGNIHPQGGPASRQLARAVEREILTKPEYRALGVDVETYFDAGSNYEYIDLLALSDRLWGWDSDYRVLRRAAREGDEDGHGGDGSAFALWPLTERIASGVWRFLHKRPIREPGVRHAPESESEPPQATTVIRGHKVPNPEALGPLLAAAEYGWIWCASAYLERCTIDHPASVWENPAQQRQYAELVRQLSEWDAHLPSRNGSVWLAEQLKRWSWKFPRPIFWLAVGLVALVLRRPRGSLVLLALTALAGLVLAVHAASGVLLGWYGVPVYPAFFLLSAAALTGRTTGRACWGPQTR